MTLPKQLLPETWLADAFIAGGYAAAPERAGDVDVWVTVPLGNALSAVRDELVEHLASEGFRFIPQQARIEAVDDVIVEPEYDVPFMSQKVALVTGSRGAVFGRPYHIIVTNGTVDEVLAGFDISTHQVAFHPTRGLVKGPGWTPLYEFPVILRTNVHTADRLVKITERYREHRAEHVAA